MDLDAMHEFLCEWQDRVEETQEGGYRIREILYRQRDDMEREYLELLVKSRAAWRVADRGPLGHRRGDRVHRAPPGRRGGGRSAASQHGGTPS
jgi:hypothetical protein